MLIEMVVTGLAIDPVSNAPIVILREKGGERLVPIWIGVVEASAIAFELEEVKLPRPMTHDLLKATIEALGGSVMKVAVVDLRDNTYFALVVLEKDGQTIEIDARPSDAIALALRSNAPVLCDSEVVERAHVLPQDVPDNKEEGAAAEADKPGEEDETGSDGPRPIVDAGSLSPEELLESLTPEDFGKYKM